MWSYYGSKNRIVKFYPKPINNTIIEPFAGAAYYSLRYFENDITLVDKSNDIIDVWEYLKNASINDINGLPIFNEGYRIKEQDFSCVGEYKLMRFLICQASFGGNNVVSKWGAMRLVQNINRVKKNLFKIKHWKFLCDSYENIDNKYATWFIDPPYFKGGHKYPQSNKKIDFNHLREYCKHRLGQVIVCENQNGNWLDFVPLTTTFGVKKKTIETIWTNYHTDLQNKQMKFF